LSRETDRLPRDLNERHPFLEAESMHLGCARSPPALTNPPAPEAIDSIAC
jgi:hypothetical protein